MTSRNGDGIVLLHNNFPVIYVYRVLTLTEIHYAPIDEELLDVMIECTRFHQSIYAKKILLYSIINDLCQFMQNLSLKVIYDCYAY